MGTPKVKIPWSFSSKEKAQFANALKGNKRGNPIALNDVSPIEHDIACKVEGKNLIPYPYANTTKTMQGITFTDNGDGSVTINGTATGAASFYLYMNRNKLPLNLNEKSGKSITLSKNCSDSTQQSLIRLYLDYYANGKTNTGISIGSGSSGTKVIGEDWQGANIYISIPSGTTITNLTVYPQLEKGTTATPYTPYMESVEGVEVRAYGKNLFDVNSITRLVFNSDDKKETKGYQENGVLYGLFGSYGGACYWDGFVCDLPIGTYTISCDAYTNMDDTRAFLARFIDIDTNERINPTSDATRISTKGEKKRFSWTVDITKKARLGLALQGLGSANNIDKLDVQFSNIQIEAGATATEYEPYKAPITYAADANGNVVLDYCAPSLTLIAGAVALMDVEYNRDINKVDFGFDATAMQTQINVNTSNISDIGQSVTSHEDRIAICEDRITVVEKLVGVEETEFITVEGANETITVPDGALPFAQIQRISGKAAVYYYEPSPGHGIYSEFVRNYPVQLVTDDGRVLLSIPSAVLAKLEEFGLCEGNYVYFEDGRAIYHQEYVDGPRDDMFYDPPVEGAEFVGSNCYSEYYDQTGGIWRLPQAIETDLTELWGFDGVLNVGDVQSIRVVMYHSEAEIDAMNDDYEYTDENGEHTFDHEWNVGYTKIVFEV